MTSPITFPNPFSRIYMILIFVLIYSSGLKAQQRNLLFSAGGGYALAKDAGNSPIGELKVDLALNKMWVAGIGGNYMQFENQNKPYTAVYGDITPVLNPDSKFIKLFLLVQPGYGIYSDKFELVSQKISFTERGGFYLGTGLGTWIPLRKKLDLSLQAKYIERNYSSTMHNEVSGQSVRDHGTDHALAFIIGIRIVFPDDLSIYSHI